MAAKKKRPTRGYKLSDFKGTYVMRFDGLSMFDTGAGPVPFFLVGVGHVKLDGKGGLTGTQTSSTTPLAGGQVALLHCKYNLSGTYQVNSDGTGTATMDFASQTRGCADETGTFDFLVSAQKGFWLISTGATAQGSKVDEVVRAEAIRISK